MKAGGYIYIMCGIAGIISSRQPINFSSLLQRMADSLTHRGPDGEGSWINPSGSAGLAHRRLAIIDLSDEAAQPMHYLGRYSITYNGEIYNYIELKKTLQQKGCTFQTQSDTEVILAAYHIYKERCVDYFDGMFSFAIWDEEEKTLFAARDPFGEKPFYYYEEKERFLFGSEMKALWAAGVPRLAENKMVLNYITLGYVQNPSNKAQTFYKDIYSLPPAHSLCYDAKDCSLKIKNYWILNRHEQSKLSETDAFEQFEFLFDQSVARRLRSDVALGSSLSGGLDSSSIATKVTALLKRENGNGSFKTFSAVFPGFEKDEKKYIDEVSRSCGFENFTVTPTAEGLLADFEKMCHHQEEPFPSASIYAQYKVFELASSHGVKVLLDGQGADEVLAGYHKYLHWYLQELVSARRYKMLRNEHRLFQKHQMKVKWGFANFLAVYFPSHVSIALEQKEFRRVVHHPDINKDFLTVLKGREWDGIHKPIVTKLNDILYFNTIEFGLEELLRFSDRNSMAHSTEVRLPFLNKELVSFIFSLPSDCKIRNGFTKFFLRKMMDKKLPDSIVWRTDKIGYEPPQKLWMEQPQLVEYMQEAKKKLVNANILKPEVLEKKIIPLNAHDAFNNDWRYLCVARML